MDSPQPDSPENGVSQPDNASETNHVMKKFIETYELLPQLWNATSPLYMNKYRRNEGLAKLLDIFKQLKPDATIKDVRKKVNTLRSNYRRELNKIKASKRTGSGTEDVYTPSSWVFHALSFLQDNESPVMLQNRSEENEIDQVKIAH